MTNASRAATEEVSAADFDPGSEKYCFGNARLLARLAKAAYLQEEFAGAAKALGFDQAIAIDGAAIGDTGGERPPWATSTQLFIVTLGETAIVTFRGSEQKADDWRVDLDAPLFDLAGCTVHAGFWHALDHVWPVLIGHLQRLSPTHLWITGHSLGGALAILCAARLCRGGGLDDPQAYPLANNLRGVYTFGQPRVGDWTFAAAYGEIVLPAAAEGDRRLALNTFRFVNRNDVVPRVPPLGLGYRHAGRMLHLGSDDRLREVDAEDNLASAAVAGACQMVEGGEESLVADHGMDRYIAALGRQSTFQPKDYQHVSARQVIWEEWKLMEEALPGQTQAPGFPVGLALSGGGIRSATFNLGLLQSLCQCGLIKQVDYLSSVSGGGYISGWLKAWQSRGGPPAPQETDTPTATRPFADACEPPEVTWLRRFSNYLTPRAGILSADTLTAVATWLRNTLLNQVLLALGLSLLIALVWGTVWVAAQPVTAWHWAAGGVWLAATAVGLVAAMREAYTADAGNTGNGTISRSAATILALGVLLAPAVVLWVKPFMVDIAHHPHRLLNAVVWSPPAFLLGAFIAMTLISAFLARYSGEQAREWWARAAGHGLHMALLWLIGVGLTLYAPYAWMWLNGQYVALGGIAWAATTIGGLLAAYSAKSGSGSGSGWRELAARLAPYAFIIGVIGLLAHGTYKGLEHLAADRIPTEVVCPKPEKIPGWEPSQRLTSREGGLQVDNRKVTNPCAFTRYGAHTVAMLEAQSWPALAIWGIGFVAFCIFGHWVSINRFSIHYFYRNRLERCYLGASNRDRQPNFYTGFDPDDSPDLKDLASRPYPLVNGCLNLTYDPQANATDRLGWQERKGAAFLFSPLYCGYRLAFGKRGFDAYQPTADFAKTSRIIRCLTKDEPNRLTLGMAMTISGAAASPNSGYHTSAATAFLMTLFNARLGWWLQNPRQPASWRDGEPGFSPWLLTEELLGMAADSSKYVYVSDGGHFENLGIYELVRRRCRIIIASDAGADPGYGFEDLGNAVRKCRTDFGVDIEIDPRAIIPGTNGLSRYHCAVGSIRYPGTADEPPTRGQLLYLKSSLTGNESADLLQYRSQCPDFPQQPTADQWFDESQFESYRKLGQHIGETVIGREYTQAVRAQKCETPDLTILMERLWRRWHQPSPYVEASMSRHGEVLDKLIQELRDNDNLAVLDAQLNTDWTAVVAAAPMAPEPQALRVTLYFCARLFQFMEDVYIDLHLEEDRHHPDVHGWMNLFRQWAHADLMRTAWAVFGSTYGQRFRDFAQVHLDFPAARIQIAPLAPDSLPAWVPNEITAWLQPAAADRYPGWIRAPWLFTMDIAGVNLEFGVAVIGTRDNRDILLDFLIRPHLRGVGLGRKTSRLLAKELTAQKPGCLLTYRRDIGGRDAVALHDILRAANFLPD